MSELYDILTETPPTKVVLLALDQGLWDCERSLAELSALCEANHMEAVAQITQKRQTPETGIVLGSGKLEEASLAAQTMGAECAVFDGELTGSQIRNISNALGGLEVIDRTMLILEIFRSRAVTNEGKLQTELALLRYRLPRLQGMGESLSRQGVYGADKRESSGKQTARNDSDEEGGIDLLGDEGKPYGNEGRHQRPPGSDDFFFAPAGFAGKALHRSCALAIGADHRSFSPLCDGGHDHQRQDEQYRTGKNNLR